MKILFQKRCRSICRSKTSAEIFQVDNELYCDRQGNAVSAPPELPEDERKLLNWCLEWYDDEMPLTAQSDETSYMCSGDELGNYGYVNLKDEYVISPQYPHAYDFTNGLACVNRERIYYKNAEGKACCQDFYGYIDRTGKPVIDFQYQDAFPFNKYGLAHVIDCQGSHLIDQQGNEIPGTRFADVCLYFYDNRYFLFTRDEQAWQNGQEAPVGLYDTKERKILHEPLWYDALEISENCIELFPFPNATERCSCYVDGRLLPLYPALDTRDDCDIEMVDRHNVAAVRVSSAEEGGSYRYGLYSARGVWLLPPVYDRISVVSYEDLWACEKDGTITVVETEYED